MTKKVLIVDDDKLVRESIDAMLRGSGHETLEAENGQKGLDTALAQHPDLIIADVRMPELDGITMAEKLRQDEWGKNVPVIILSDDDTTGTINQALTSGVTVYLSKSGLTSDSLKQQLLTALG
jgi:CheY-like chemotaxis protein